MIDLPCFNIGEVTLIGTGGGYGESCIVHIGNNEWIVIDSCQDPHTKKSLPVDYLISIGVEVKTQVKCIICSHWHDDHILGMSQLLALCENALFFFASCTDKDKFLLLLDIDAAKAKDEVWSSSTTEFYRCLHIIADRSHIPKRASQDRILYKSKKNEINCEIWSLSPSDFTLSEFDKELSSLIKIVSQRNKKLVNKSPNAKSVVIYVKLNDHRILLGADLENAENKNEGWTNILENCISIDKKASLFKVPHHGSENGYSSAVWDSLLTDNPIAKITPWNRKITLPKIEMLKLLSMHSDKIYLTANVNTLGNKAKKREQSIERLILENNSSLHEIKYRHGIIRSRINIIQPNSDWEVTTFGDAIHVNTVILSK
jgi:beta-lactamase superfamily II metal-dependent hydrolase